MLFTSRRYEKMTEALSGMSERLKDLESGFKRMRLEWEDTFDKLQAVVQRIAKRAQRVEQFEQEAREQEPEPDTPALPSSLTPNQRAAQARILERRTRLQRPS
jgi:hypothetical protein